MQALDQDVIRALGKRGNGNLRALSTGDDSALEGLSYLENLDVGDLVDPVEDLEIPLPYQETEQVGAAHELGYQEENTSILVNR